MKTVDQVDKVVHSSAVAVLSAIFMAAIPLILVVTNIQLAFYNLWLYKYGYEKYQVSSYTGIPMSDLIHTSEQMIEFFNSRDGFPEIKVFKGGQNSVLFNARETTHLEDVRDLLNRFITFRNIAALYIAVYSLSAMSFLKGRGILLVSSKVKKSGIITITGLALFGFTSLFGFDQLFVEFHMLSFSNNLWQLTPSTDYLLMMFPDGFWFDSTMLIGLSTAMEAIALLLISIFAERAFRSSHVQ